MANTDDKNTATSEAARAAWEAVSRYLEGSASIGRGYSSTWADAVQASVQMAIDFQVATIQTSLLLFDATARASMGWFTLVTEVARGSQETSP